MISSAGRDDRPAHLQRAVQQPRIDAPHRVEAAIDQRGQPALLAVRVHEARAHDRRQRDRDDAGDDDRGGQRDGELQEQRAGQPALEADRRIDRGQRDGHRDDRADQLARADERGLDARLALAHVPLDVFDHDDRVIHHQPDRQHDREDRQQVQAEAEGAASRCAAPTSETGMATSGTSAVRTEPMNRNTTSADDQHRLGERLGDLLQRVAMNTVPS